MQLNNNHNPRGKKQKEYLDTCEEHKNNEIINTISLKKFATSNLNEHNLLKELLLEEQSEMSGEEFLIKISVWLKLLHKEEQKNKMVKEVLYIR